MKRIIALIPARMASSRFPGKPLISICGKTMIEHVWQRVKMNVRIDRTFIATCDEEIRQAAEGFGADVIMTDKSHQRGTDRIAEACEILIKQEEYFDIALNVQGDEPLLNPETLDLVIDSFFKEDDIRVVNLIEKLEGEEEINSINNVKAIFDQFNFAIYFSRLPIPTGIKNKHFKQLGLYGFSRDAILQYPKMAMTPLEIAESDDMLRFVENRIPIKVPLSPYKTYGVDTKADFEMVSQLMEDDVIFHKYRSK